jgi:membrane fusion protein (multidrug efflux system)
MRYAVAILALVLLVGGLATVKVKQIQQLISFGKQMEKQGPPPETVSSKVADEQVWGGTLVAIGTINAVKGVAIGNEVPGVKSIHFESGALVQAGQVLVTLDSTVERSQLASIQARRDLAMINEGRTRALVESGSIAQAQLDGDVSSVKVSRADLGALKAQIDRKLVRAPFAGRLGIRQVNLGQYLQPGTTLVTLESLDSVFVDFTLPQQILPTVKLGMSVHVEIEGAKDLGADGVIMAIDPSVDATTRTIKLRATVPNKGEKLRPGMFANVTVQLPERAPVVTVPASAVVHASYGDSVFVIEDKKDAPTGPDGKPPKMARQQFVRVGESRGDFVAILDGITKGQEVVSAGAFKLRNGAGIVVNNEIGATPKLDPRPENR